MKKKETKDNRGITLVALIVTIIILLILAGVAIASLGGENGLIAKAEQAKKAQIKTEMKEKLTLAISELQLEKEGEVTLDDITQNWINGKLVDYNSILKEDASVNGKIVIIKKDEIIGKFLVDKNLNITELEYNESSIEFTYGTQSRDGNNVKILIKVADNVNGLKQIEYQDEIILNCNGKKEIEIDYTVELGTEYKFKIISETGKEEEKTILITDYYYKIIKNFEEGINIDNTEIKAAYNKSYTATIVEKDGYIMDTLEVKMGGKNIEVDEDTGIINIEKVTGDIEINITATELTPLEESIVDFWSFNNSLESSIENNDKKEKFEIYKGNNLKFENDSMYLESTILTTENNYLLPDEFSVVFKYKPININTWTLILGKITGYANFNTYNGIFIRNNMDEGKLCNGISHVQYKVDNILTIGIYSTLAFTYDGTNCRLYKDGELITKIKGYNDINSKMFLGGSIYSGTGAAGYQWGYADGYFKDLAIYNRRLSITELKNLN